MLVLNRAVVLELAVNRTGRDDRSFTFEVDECFENGFTLANGAPGIFEIGGVTDTELSLAVVSEIGRLENGWQPELVRGRDEFFQTRNAPEWSEWEASPG